MIIVCAGDSFTEGAELVEENINPEYAKLSLKDAAKFSKKMWKEGKISDSYAKSLTYAGHLEKTLNCKVINVGLSGSSEIDIIQRMIVTLSKTKKKYPNEKLVCILQDTDPNRIWLWDKHFMQNKSYSITYIEDRMKNKIDAYSIKDVTLTYWSQELQYSEFIMQILAVQHYCSSQSIKFIHFGICKNDIPPPTDIESVLYMKSSNLYESYSNDQYCAEESVKDKLKMHYNNFLLPGLHVNCESQKQIGEWLISYMKKQGIICPV